MSRAFVICLSWNFPASHITLCTHNMGYEEGKTCPQTMYMHPAKMECLLDSLNNTESHSKAFYIVKIRGGFLRVYTNSINQKNFKQRHPFVKKKVYFCLLFENFIHVYNEFWSHHLPSTPTFLRTTYHILPLNFIFSAFASYWVQLVLPICAWDHLLEHANYQGSHHWRKLTLPSSSSHQLSMSPQLKVGIFEILPYPQAIIFISYILSNYVIIIKFSKTQCWSLNFTHA